MMRDHEHAWDAGEIICNDQRCPLVDGPHGSHPALICDGCETVVDLAEREHWKGSLMNGVHHGSVAAGEQHGEVMRPDCAIVGSPLPDGRVRLIASKNLLDAWLDYQFAWAPSFDGLVPPAQVTYSIITTMSDVVIIEAEDYPSALRGLMNHWNGSHARPVDGQRQVER